MLLLIISLVIIALALWVLNKHRAISGSAEDEYQEFYIIRHGETDTNLAGLANTKGDEISLNSTGRDQALRTGKYLKTRGIKPKIISSPAMRAMETAEIIAEVLGVEVVQDERLSEQDKGEFSGIDMKQRPDLVNRLNKVNKAFEEKYKDPIERVKSFDEYLSSLSTEFHGEDIIKKVKDLNAVVYEHSGNGPIVIVTHSGNIDTWLPYIAKTNPRIFLHGDMSNGKNCSIAYMLMRNGTMELLIQSNTSHLSLN